ncbi:MAG: anti-sigma factor antagonist BldG [Vulcanimicrobiaceae bacterium]
MSHDELSIDIKTENEAGAVVFTLHGTLDLATSPMARAAFLEAANDGRHEIIVDLSRVEFLDSTGLGALIGGHRRAAESGGGMRLVVNDGPISRLLNITGLMRVLEVYPSVSCALHQRDRLAGTL